MKLRLVFLLGLAALFVCTPRDALAQGNMIRGKVRVEAGGTLAHIIVVLESGTGARVGQTATNGEGDFAFPGLEDTSYIVVVNEPDYQPFSESVELSVQPSANRPGETRMVFVTLVPKPGTYLPPARVKFVQVVPQAAREAFDRGTAHARGGKRVEAVAAFGEAAGLFPNYFDARLALGHELMRVGRYDEAIAELERARHVNPNDDRVFLVFGLVLNRQQKFAVAAAVFAEAARINGTDPQYPLLRGIALVDQVALLESSKHKDAPAMRNDMLVQAEADLTQAFALSKKTLAAVHLQLARVYEKRGDPARAADELDRYLKQSPKAPNAVAIRGAIAKLRARKE
jgi:tetratricopeptide (TPR) repeat protein